MQRGIGLLYLLTIFLSTSLFATSTIHFTALANDPYWHTLLHMRDGKSEIDDVGFFLSPVGKTDPHAELEETLKALRDAKDETTVCRYPARTAWLLSKLPQLDEQIKFQQCSAFETMIKAYDPNYISLIFPTAHINSPASMYGHSFLRIDNDRETPLISQAINYAAQTNETNGLFFAYHGLTGGYKGMYSILPYYMKIKEYNDMERRDIWEYHLSLTKPQIKKLLMHQYELRESYADYYFFTENCSYNLLWLLQAADIHLSLVDQFRYKAIPVDTIRVVQDAGIIEDVSFRPSKSKKMQSIADHIEDFGITEKFLEDFNPDRIDTLCEMQQVYQLDLAVEMLRFRRAKNSIEKETYVHELMKLLKLRSRLKEKPDYEVTTPVDPLKGHKTSRTTIAISDSAAWEMSFKPSFHDRYDLDAGYKGGAYINFFALTLAKKRDDSVRLKEFTLVDIASFAPRNRLFQPLSWGLYAGLREDYRNNMATRIEGSVGSTWEIATAYTYVMFSPAISYTNALESSFAPKVGFFKSTRAFKYGAEIKREFFDSGDALRELEAFVTYNVGKQSALHVKVHDQKHASESEQTVSFGLFYYF